MRQLPFWYLAFSTLSSSSLRLHPAKHYTFLFEVRINMYFCILGTVWRLIRSISDFLNCILANACHGSSDCTEERGEGQSQW